MLTDLLHPLDLIPDFQDRSFDAFFALSLLKAAALLTVIGFAFTKCQPWFSVRYYDGGRPTYFGLRWGLLFLAARALLIVISLGAIAGTLPTSAYSGVPGLVGLILGGLARGTLAYTLIRLPLHPTRAAGITEGDTVVAVLTVIVSALGTISRISLQTRLEIAHITIGTGSSYASTSKELATGALGMTIADSSLTIALGLVGLVSAIFAHRKSRQLQLSLEKKMAIRLTIAAASVWVAASLVKTVFTGLVLAPLVSIDYNPLASYVSYGTAFAMNLVELFSEVAISTLLVLCFRPAKDVLPTKEIED